MESRRGVFRYIATVNYAHLSVLRVLSGSMLSASLRVVLTSIEFVTRECYDILE